MKIAKDFIIQEFVPKETYSKWGKKSIRFINPKLPVMAQGYKDFYKGKSVTINNWLWGGVFNYSGYRPPECDIGAPESAHRRGMALDLKIKDVEASQVQEDTKNNENYFMNLGVTCMELDTDTWTHVGCEWFCFKDDFLFDKIHYIPLF